TPTPRKLSVLRPSTTLPSASWNMVGVAFNGAFSRKLRNRLRPFPRWMVMNPPPPILPQHGCTTASAKPTATAASTALPPRLRMSTPTMVARCCALTTMACLAVTGFASCSAARVLTGSRPVASGLTSWAQVSALNAASIAASRTRRLHWRRCNAVASGGRLASSRGVLVSGMGSPLAVIESGIFASACATTRQLHPPRSVRAAYEQIVHDILDTHRDGILAGQLKQIADLPARCSGFRFAQGRCVERDADGLDRRIGQARGDEIGFEAEFQLGQRAIRQAAHMPSGRLVAQHQGGGLGSMQQAERHAGIGRVEQRTLAFDQVPATVEAGRRNLFGRAGD